jgi:hypothetical protein
MALLTIGAAAATHFLIPTTTEFGKPHSIFQQEIMSTNSLTTVGLVKKIFQHQLLAQLQMAILPTVKVL